MCATSMYLVVTPQEAPGQGLGMVASRLGGHRMYGGLTRDGMGRMGLPFLGLQESWPTSW